MADTSLGISLVIKAVDQGTAVLGRISAALEKIGLSSQQAGAKSAQAGQQIEDVFKRTSEQLEKTNKTLKKVEDTLFGVGTVMSAVGAAILAPLGLGTKAAADFEKEMLKVKAVTNFSTDTGTAQKEFEQLSDKARELGTSLKSPTYSAAQAAQGLAEFGRAGFTAAQSIEAIGPAINLAFVEGRGTKETVEDLVGILASYQYGVEQSSRVTDVLAYTANATTTDMAGLAESLKYSATLASQLGMDVETTTGFLGMFAQNNLKGSLAGTALRRIMAELSNPLEDARATLASMNVEVAKNADGSLNLVGTFERLAKSGLSTANAFKIFGDLGANAALVATKNIEKIKGLTAANYTATGSLQKMVDTINSGLGPALEKLRNVVLDVGIQFAGPFLSGLTAIVNGISSALKWVIDLGKQFPTLSKAVVGGLGGLGLVAAVLGTIAFAASGLSYAWRKVSEGLLLVLGAGTRFLGMARSKLVAIEAETAAIQRQTAAVNALAAANQRTINAMSNPKHMGSDYVPVLTGRTGGPPTPTPSPGLKFSGAGAAGGLLAAASGSEALDVVKWAGISAAVQLVSSNIGVVIGKIAALIPTWGMVTSAIGTFISALGTAGTAIAAFAVTPLGLVAGAIAAVVGAVAGGYKILSDRREAAEIQADTLKRSQEDLNRAMREGFDPSKTMKGISTAALTTDPYTDLLTKRKAAVADFVGWNEKLTQAREKDAKSLLGGKSEETKSAERSVYLARQNLDLVQTEINKRIDQKQAVENVGKEYEKNTASAQAELKTTEQLLQISKDRAETEVKLIADSVKTKEGLNALELESAKVRINATVQSEIQARNLIDGLVVASAQQRIALAETEYMQTRMAREKGFAEQQALYEGMIAKGEKVGESQKGLQELEKARADSQIADSQKLTQAIVQELNTQLKAKDEQVKKIRDLEKQSRDEQVATSDALKGISGAYLTEYGKIAARVSDVGEKLKEATRLVPSMPERALDLFKQVRSESSGLIQNIESFNDKLRNAAFAGQDALRKINTFGLGGADKYKAEIKDIETMIKRANDAVAGGRFQEAENLYKSVMSAAQGLPGSAEKTGDVTKDAANVEKAKADARALIGVASGGLTDVIKVQKAQAEEANRQAKENIEKENAAIKNLIEAQIDSAREQIRALDDNTAALRGKLPGAQGKTEQGQALSQAITEAAQKAAEATGAGQVSGTAAGSISGALPSDLSPDLALNPDVLRQRQEAQKLVELERGQALNAAMAKFPELAGMVSPEDFESARSVTASEEAARQARMAELKRLEARAGQLDASERGGYSASPRAVSQFQSDLDAVTGQKMTGGVVDAMQARLNTFYENVAGQMGAAVESAKNGAFRGDTTPNVTEAAAEMQQRSSAEMVGAVELFKDAVKAVRETFGEKIQISVNVENGEGTITRY